MSKKHNTGANLKDLPTIKMNKIYNMASKYKINTHVII